VAQSARTVAVFIPAMGRAGLDSLGELGWQFFYQLSVAASVVVGEAPKDVETYKKTVYYILEEIGLANIEYLEIPTAGLGLTAEERQASAERALGIAIPPGTTSAQAGRLYAESRPTSLLSDIANRARGFWGSAAPAAQPATPKLLP
jgi:hypothetical protein